MRFDDRAANRQSHAHPAGLGAEEGTEHPLQIVWLDADAAVLHGDDDVIATGPLRPDDELPRPFDDGRHGVDGVDREENHLLQLNPID